jgi:hypothetical protein
VGLRLPNGVIKENIGICMTASGDALARETARKFKRLQQRESKSHAQNQPGMRLASRRAGPIH